MTEELKQLKDNCSVKEARFIELYILAEEEKINAYNKAGYKAKNTSVASSAVCRLLKKAQCTAYLEALKHQKDVEMFRKSNITRTTQLIALNEAFKLAKAEKNPSAMVSAIREQNEMMGYHRENAPNPEKELARKHRAKEEEDYMRQIVRQRTSELAGGRIGAN